MFRILLTLKISYETLLDLSASALLLCTYRQVLEFEGFQFNPEYDKKFETAQKELED